MARLKLTIAYDGQPFLGWQSQTGGCTIQDHLEAAFAKICTGRTPVHGSGRTDAGVHAIGQVAHVDVAKDRLQLRQWILALNANLPPEIRVMQARWVKDDFHARFSATGKIYRYRIWNAPVLPPLEIGRAWQIPQPLDIGLLRRCADTLTGCHDFAAFAANRGVPTEDTVRTIRRIDVKGRPGGLITLTFEGDGFLYKMVRLLTGSLIRCAQKRAEPEWIAELLQAKGKKTSFAAAADGLYLVKVLY